MQYPDSVYNNHECEWEGEVPSEFCVGCLRSKLAYAEAENARMRAALVALIDALDEPGSLGIVKMEPNPNGPDELQCCLCYALDVITYKNPLTPERWTNFNHDDDCPLVLAQAALSGEVA